MAKPRYVRVRFEKPEEFCRLVQECRVYALVSGRQHRDITSLVPTHLARLFWNAKEGDRIPGTMLRARCGHCRQGAGAHVHPMARRVNHHLELAVERVVFKFAEIVAAN